MKYFDPKEFVNPVDLVFLVGTRNRLGLLKTCLESILIQDDPSWRIIVIDAGSTDGTPEYLKSLIDPRVSLVEDGRMLGQARSLNQVLRQINCNYVCWLSDDNALTGFGIFDAIEALRSDPRFGMIGLKVKDVSGPHACEPYIGGIWSSGVMNINQGLIRFPLFKELGFFDETYGSYGIDTDLTTRVLLEGYSVGLTRKVTVLHDRRHIEMPGAFTSEERRLENERAKALYETRYYRPLFGFWYFLYLNLAKHIWTLIFAPEFLKPYRNRFANRYLKPRTMYFRCLRNVVFGRWISFFDFLIYRGTRVYLVQRIPRFWRWYYKTYMRLFPRRSLENSRVTAPNSRTEIQGVSLSNQA